MEAQVIAGRYKLERRLGAGGMSEVWAAQDLELDRTVAVKLLAPDADPARFDREARSAAALSHPNICALYDYGEDAGRRYMVLEYLPGGSLEDRLAAGKPLPDDETRGIARQIAAGLAHAHDRGLVHRDLKPSNILFDGEGRAKIADFGIARLQTAPGMTEAGTVLGTAAYISPEQAAGEPATPASDVYAFGVILFRMLTGRLPFEALDALALAAMHRDRPPPPVSDFRRDAPPQLESLAMAALSKSPADRPPNGRALLEELGAPASAPPADATALTQVVEWEPEPSPEQKGHRKLVLALIAVAALAAAGIGLAVGVSSGGDGPSLGPPLSTTQKETTTKAQPTTSSSTFTPSPQTTTRATSSTTTTRATTTAKTTTTAATTTTPTTTAPSFTTLPLTTTAPPPPTTTPVTTAPPPPPPTTTAPATDTTTTTFTDTTAATDTTATVTTPAPPAQFTTTSTVPPPG